MAEASVEPASSWPRPLQLSLRLEAQGKGAGEGREALAGCWGGAGPPSGRAPAAGGPEEGREGGGQSSWAQWESADGVVRAAAGGQRGRGRGCGGWERQLQGEGHRGVSVPCACCGWLTTAVSCGQCTAVSGSHWNVGQRPLPLPSLALPLLGPATSWGHQLHGWQSMSRSLLLIWLLRYLWLHSCQIRSLWPLWPIWFVWFVWFDWFIWLIEFIRFFWLWFRFPWFITPSTCGPEECFVVSAHLSGACGKNMHKYTYSRCVYTCIHVLFMYTVHVLYKYMYMIRSCTCICKGRQDKVRHSPKVDSEH